MANARLFRHDVTILRASTGSDTRLVPAGSATVEVYKQGATISAGKTLTGPTDTIAVHDTGGIVVGDVLQLGTSASTTFTVTLVSNNQVTVGSFAGSPVVAAGDRLIVQSTRPSVFANPSGTTQVDSTNQGRAPTTGATTGLSSFYTALPTVDLIASGGGLAASQLLIDQSGQMASRVVRIEDFGGYEASLLPGNPPSGNFDNVGVFDDALNYLQAIGGGELVFGPGVYVFNTSTTISSKTAGIKLRGAGIKRTNLFLNSASGALFTIASSTTDFALEDMTVSRLTGTPALIIVDAAADQFACNRVRFAGTGSGVADSGTSTKLVDCEFEGDVTTCITKPAGDNAHYIRPRFRCTDGAIGANALMAISGGSDHYIEDFDAEWLAPEDAGEAVRVSGTCSRVTFAGGTFSGGTAGGGAGAIAIAISGGKGIRFLYPVCHNSNRGIVISGGTGLQVLLPLVIDSQSFGIQVTAGAHIDIIFPLVSESNTLGAVTTGHVEVAGSVSHCRVIGPRTGQLTIGIGGGGTPPDVGVDINDGTGQNIMLLMAAGLASTGGLWRVAKTGTTNTKFITSALHQSQFAALTNQQSGIAFVPRDFTTETTPDVEGVSYITSNPTAGSISMTNLTNGIVGQLVTVENVHATNTVTFSGGNFSFTSLGTPTLNQFECATFFKNSNNVWRHIPTGAV